jgi:glycosyltransferase involved in cell wall biosynthesis
VIGFFSRYLQLMKLSVVIITFNEERNIARCLENIQELADEIIVVDSFSTDQTEAICKTYPVKFIKHNFEGNIKQQSFACAQATNEYILSLDADEILSDELKHNILALKTNSFSKDAYYMNRLTSFCGHWIKHGMWYPDKKLRLYFSEKGSWGGTEPHGLVVMQPNAKSGFVKGDILHYSYSSIEEVIIRNNKYTNIMAKTMWEKGKRASWLNLIVSPFWAFISGYIFKLGFLDGSDGFFIASSVAYQTMTKYAKLLRLQKEHSK